MKDKPKLGDIKTAIKWRDFFESEYLASWDLDGDTVVAFSKFRYEEVTGEKGRKDKCLVAYFEDYDKGMIVNVTNSKTISQLLGSIYPIDWIGKKITLFVDDNVKSKGGEIVSGIRVRPTIPVKARIGEPRFTKMVEAIKGGKYEKVMAYESYELTDPQRKIIAAL